MDELNELFNSLDLSKKLKKAEYEILISKSSKILKDILKGVPVKCEAMTKAGAQCSYAAKDGSVYCKRHMDYVKTEKDPGLCTATLKNGAVCNTASSKTKPIGAKNNYCYRHSKDWKKYEPETENK